MNKILSLGAGVQSSVMALMSEKGELPPVDAMIFADTQFEPKSVYAHLDWLETQLSTPVYRVSIGNIRDDHIRSVSEGTNIRGMMPLFTGNGFGRRQCTNAYKIEPVKKQIRTLLGLKKRQRVPKGIKVEQWLGISTDEAARMKPSTDKWINNKWPLVEMGMSRQHCLLWFEKNYPSRVLAKSACICCPYHNDAMWRDMKINDPTSFAEAVEFDRQIRISQTGKEQYVHKTLKPLGEVDFRNLEDKGQINMFNNECEGMCGV
jgi:hypothetical protein